MLSYQVVYDPESDMIINEYTAAGSITIPIEKSLTGARTEWIDVDQYYFELLDDNGERVGDIVTIDSSTSGHASTFAEITYDLDDLGDHVYTIRELTQGDYALPGGVSKITGDITATVSVTDLGDGNLNTSVTYEADGEELETPVIVNEYTVTPTNVTINVEKSITDFIAGADTTFYFTLKDGDGEIVQEDLPLTTTDGAGTASFNALEFTEAGTYTYTVTEKEENADNYGVYDGGYDSTEKTITITVKDDNAGKLYAEIGEEVASSTDVEVVNIFHEEGTEVTISVEKTIDDQSDSAQDKTFKFELYEAVEQEGGSYEKGDKIEEISVTTTDLTGEGSFKTIGYTEAGVYRYIVVEVDESEEGDGWSYDTNEYLVTVTIEDDFTAAVLARAIDADGGEVAEDNSSVQFSFENVYKAASTETILVVTKAIDDTTGTAYETTFEFVLKSAAKDEESGTVTAGDTIETKSITGEGTVEFTAIPYEKAGTYYYVIVETDSGDAGYTYDSTEHVVIVTVSDEEAQLVASVDYGTNETSETGLTVTNTYDPEDASAQFEFVKKIKDTSGSASDAEFTFDLYEGDEVIDTQSRTKGGPVYFKELTYDQPGTYSYVIRERGGDVPGYSYDTSDHNVTVEVTDNQGTLSAEVKYDDASSLEITNTYEPEPAELELTVRKKLVGDGEYLDADSAATFTFKLFDSTGAAVSTATVTGAGETSFDTLTYTEVGTYIYTISEVDGGEAGYTYDPTVHTVEVVVADNNGVLELTYTIDGSANTTKAEFSNTFKLSPVYIDPPVWKVISGDTPSTAATFKFRMEAASNTAGYAVADMPMPEGSENGVKTMEIVGAGSKEFGEFAITKPGTYVYNIYEVNTGYEGYTYDTKIYTLTAEVTVEGDKLELKDTYTWDGKAVDTPVFTNEYEKPDEPLPTPKTGDTTNTGMWTILGGAVAIGTVECMRLINKKRREEIE